MFLVPHRHDLCGGLANIGVLTLPALFKRARDERSLQRQDRQKKESYNLAMPLTALDLSPEELKKYRPLDAIRRRRAKSSAEIARRRRRARLVARKAAKLLKTEFGAKEVILFGSLARRVGFTSWSDIDLASRGIPSDKFLTAMDTVLYLSPEFKIDLVELETCSPTMRRSIETEGKPL